MSQGCCGGGIASPAPSNSGCCSTVCFSTLILRLTLGGFLFFMGLGKFMMGVSAFVAQYSPTFESSWLPMGVVTLWLTVLPYLEFVVGALLVLGLFTRWAAVAAGFMFMLFIWGGTLSGQPDIFYNVFLPFFAAMWLIKKPYSSVSLDKVLGCKTC